MKLKLTYKFIWAALVATAMLAACTKDPVPGKSDSDSAVTYRTITVSFDTPTKAKLDGTKPHFEEGDAILLTDGNAFDTCYVKVDGTTIQTKLAGKNLQAVYPMEAALCDTPDSIFAAGFKIPAKQSGKFSDAMMCTGTGTNKLSFAVQMPILRFYVDSTIAVKSIVIEYDGEKSFAENDSKTITVDAGSKGTLDKVTGERVCYVVVPHNVNANELTFRSNANTQGGKVVERKSPSNVGELQGGYIYNAFIPYYIEVGDQKWGYCNVGAFYPEDPGYYFAWGETTGYRFDFNNNCYVPQHSFDWKSYSFIYSYNESNPPTMTFKKYVSNPEYAVDDKPDKKTTLELEDDAAFQSWGGDWRMPTFSEFSKLTATDLKCSGAVSKYILFDDYGLILSLTGFGYDDTVTNHTCDACYWSSSISKAGDNQASILHGDVSKGIKISMDEHERRRGFPIRPIYDDTMSGGNPVGLQINAYTDGKTL